MKIKLLAALFILPLLFSCSEDMSGDENYILNLPPMKDAFSQYFLIGNIFNPNDVSGSQVRNKFLQRHFNVLTCENNMKPDQIAPGKGSYSFSTADSMVNSAIASGFKVVGHTLLWHSQIPSWQRDLASEAKETALKEMKDYITKVADHFKGRIYSWDVLNEVFPDGVSANADWTKVMRTNNPWYASIGSDFVYEGFLAARLADPNAILYYNDYNTDSPSKAKMIHDMVKAVNERYSALSAGSKPAGDPPGRLLIEGIGMQEHHNTSIGADRIKTTLNLFRTLGVIISVSELDVLAQSWGEYSSQTKITSEGRERQAQLYGEYMKVYLDNKDIIERVSLWGVTDTQSWRARGEPLLFKGNGMAKPAYHSFVGALKK